MGSDTTPSSPQLPTTSKPFHPLLYQEATFLPATMEPLHLFTKSSRFWKPQEAHPLPPREPSPLTSTRQSPTSPSSRRAPCFSCTRAALSARIMLVKSKAEMSGRPWASRANSSFPSFPWVAKSAAARTKLCRASGTTLALPNSRSISGQSYRPTEQNPQGQPCWTRI